ncbi:MAG TPA: NUDIX hydrolase [Methylocella sp.]|nr:NUDIX hydrolase [Methylocella sp.]
MSQDPPARAAALTGYPISPSLAVSIAVFRSGLVLLGRRAKPPFAGALSLPGGLVEIGERLEEAALRELREETRVEARIVAFNRHLQVIDLDDEDRVRHHFVIASFAGEWIGGEAKAGSDLNEIEWVNPSKLGMLDCTPQLGCVVLGAKSLMYSYCREPFLREL